MSLLIKQDNIYMSKLFVKFINCFIFTNIKFKMEKLMYLTFFFWKKQLNKVPLFYFFEALLKLRPLIGFYIYIVKTKQAKRVKIKPHFMSFESRWKKAIYWLSRSIKMEREKYNFINNITTELLTTINTEKSISLLQKVKYYKTILSFKTTKNFTW